MDRSLLCFALCPALGAAARFAVIAAGSKGFWNYRHQADACHAYQLMKSSGIPEENIILMMEDDVAGSSENPFPGELYNKPGINPPNVYDGCKPDYTGSVVTAKLFLSVLTGDKAGVPAGGKVLTSGPDDNVFVNFIDHGGVGLIAFPNGPVLHVKDLTKALENMYRYKMYKELVFYMEACESGSMFPPFGPNSKAQFGPDSKAKWGPLDKSLSVTASNAHESSWGTYCGSAALVKGKNMGTCLGDLFSVNWMEDSDKGAFGTETLQEQISRVTRLTTKSHVQVFGHTSLESEPIGHFETRLQLGLDTNSSESNEVDVRHDSSESNEVDVRDVPLKQAYWKWEMASNHAEKDIAARVLEEVVDGRMKDREIFHGIVKQACSGVNMIACEDHFVKSRAALQDLDCHKVLTERVHYHCPRRAPHNTGGWNGYNMQFSQVLANLCEGKQILGKSDDALASITSEHCHSETQAFVV